MSRACPRLVSAGLALERESRGAQSVSQLVLLRRSMHWISCGTAIVRAGGGLRTPAK